MEPNFKLTDGMVLLRPPKDTDIPSLKEAVQQSLSDLVPWISWASPAYNDTSARNWVEHAQLGWLHASAFHFSIIHTLTGKYLGSCGLDGIDEKTKCCNLWYWVRSSHKGHGIGSRAARLTAKFAFQTAGLIRIEILIATGNLGSQKVAEKAGAHYEKLLKNGMVLGTDVYDAMLYSLSPADFAN
ncbi:MAG: GNAT family protein [Chloroflexota bacterium]